MVTVKITETYDMKTTIGKLGILGIHTPDVALVRRLYPGLLKSHKFIRFLKCDVVGACASVLPADPLQVGVTAGDVAPEDMFNPILYKAVTNESFDTLVSRVMRSATQVTGTGSVNVQDDNNWGESSNFSIYYGLLAENGEYRKAMPQSGFAIKNLVPICHTLVSNYGNLAPIDNTDVMDVDEGLATIPDLTNVNIANDGINGLMSIQTPAVVFRGKSVRMPKLPIHYAPEAWDAIPEPDLVKTMVCALIVPPARLHEFYYRLRVTWYVRFENVCSTLTSGTGSGLIGVGSNSYAKTYNYTSSKEALDSEQSSVDASNVDLTKIMES